MRPLRAGLISFEGSSKDILATLRIPHCLMIPVVGVVFAEVRHAVKVVGQHHHSITRSRQVVLVEHLKLREGAELVSKDRVDFLKCVVQEPEFELVDRPVRGFLGQNVELGVEGLHLDTQPLKIGNGRGGESQLLQPFLFLPFALLSFFFLSFGLGAARFLFRLPPLSSHPAPFSHFRLIHVPPYYAGHARRNSTYFMLITSIGRRCLLLNTVPIILTSSSVTAMMQRRCPD